LNEVRVGANFIRCWPDQRHLCTVLPDGAEVPASPNHTPADVALAHELGYPSTWELTLAHEVCHTYLAVEMGAECSPVLWWVAHQDSWDEHEQNMFQIEEAVVLDFQRALNGRGEHEPAMPHLLPGARALIATLLGES
jgi:hypothetical protein